MASTRSASSQLAILGVLSLIFWALMLVVTLKYLSFVMRASQRRRGRHPRAARAHPGEGRPHALVLVILFGAALLYGDGVVTPAISVLSAVEGLKSGAPSLATWIVPITIVDPGRCSSSCSVAAPRTSASCSAP